MLIDPKSANCCSLKWQVVHSKKRVCGCENISIFYFSLNINILRFYFLFLILLNLLSVCDITRDTEADGEESQRKEIFSTQFTRYLSQVVKLSSIIKSENYSSQLCSQSSHYDTFISSLISLQHLTTCLFALSLLSLG